MLLPGEGEPCPLVVPAPFRSLGDDITSNATCSAHFNNPPHQLHVARPLEGQGFEVPLPFRSPCHCCQCLVFVIVIPSHSHCYYTSFWQGR